MQLDKTDWQIAAIEAKAGRIRPTVARLLQREAERLPADADAELVRLARKVVKTLASPPPEPAETG